ncbi:MAG: hypothetical protein N2C12_05690, partial [Planctomycetales bacterium]
MISRSDKNRFLLRRVAADQLIDRITQNIILPASLIALVVLLAPVARAGTGLQFSVPGPTVTSTTGIELILDTYWAQGYGYRPVRVVAKAKTPSAEDRDISIRFVADERYYGRGRQPYMTVESGFVLPAGAAKADTTIAVPQYLPWQRISWDVLVDGRYISELSAKDFSGPAARIRYPDYDTPRLLLVNPKAERGVTVGGTGPVAAVATGGAPEIDEMHSALHLKPDELPDRWIDYSTLDMVHIALEDFQDLVQDQPETWTAIRRWVGTGGTLVIRGEPDFQNRAWIDKALSLPKSETQNQWINKETKLLSYPVENSNLRRYSQADQKITIGHLTAAEAYDWQRVGQGEVVLGTAGIYNKGVLSLPAVNRFSSRWSQRHGLSPPEGTTEFWTFLIPGVGLPPVHTFWVLITIFVIVIGPGN